MNTNDIKKILNDLYTLDPGLKNHEKELIAIIQTMAIKPEAHYDPQFAATLRAKLLNELAMNKPRRQTLADIFMNRSVRYSAAGIAVVAIAAIAVTSFALKPKTGAGNLALNSTGVSIQTVGPNAFGKLTAPVTPIATSGVETASQLQSPTQTQNQSAIASPMMAAVTGSPTASAGSAIAKPIMPVTPPYFTTPKYNYTGDPITQNQTQLNVLKKTTQPLSADQATNALEQAGFGQVNLSSFSGLTMSNVTLSQNQNFGYEISLDLANGTISIDQNYTEWPQGNTTPLAASDIPSDSAVIGTANQFLSDHAISLANYGQPQVSQNNSVIVPLAASAPSSVSDAATNMPMIPYYSDTEAVLYPLVVNGQNVYDTGGNLIGLTVQVNVRYNRVSSVYGLNTESYQASAYTAITNTSTILSMAETSQSYPMIYNGTVSNGTSDVSTNVNTYDLGTPTMAYEDMYQSDSNGQSEEFLVPAFIFPVISNGSNTATQNIVVPLIQDFVQQNIGVRAIPESAGASAN